MKLEEKNFEFFGHNRIRMEKQGSNSMMFSRNCSLHSWYSRNEDLEASTIKTVKGYKLRHLNVLEKMEFELSQRILVLV